MVMIRAPDHFLDAGGEAPYLLSGSTQAEATGSFPHRATKDMGCTFAVVSERLEKR